MKIGDFKDLEEVRNHVKENGPYDNTKGGKCSQCGECCSNLLPMSRIEVETIREYIRKNDIKEYKTLFPFANPTLDLTCPFLDRNKETEKCRIYEVRPLICKAFVCNHKKGEYPEEFLTGEYDIFNLRETFFR